MGAGMWLLWLWTAVAGTFGWRFDGTAAVPGATPPTQLVATTARWNVELPATGNASPILVGDRVCATAEPTTLMCVSRVDGRTLWSATNDWLDTVKPDKKAEATELIRKGEQAWADLAETQAAYSRLQREARRADADPAAVQQLSTLAARMGELRAAADAITPYRTPERPTMGWASATPISDGTSIYAFFANGVVSSFTPDGKRRWSVWLGPPLVAMRGWETGATASPLLVDGTLVISYGAVHGLDPATGALKWSSGVYLDFGTPAVATVGGRQVIITPDGRAIDPRGGKELARGLGDVWYTSPAAVGDTVVYFGGVVEAHTTLVGGVTARAVKLAWSGDRIVGTTLWTRDVAFVDRYYATPLIYGGLVYQVTRRRMMTVLDFATGEIVYQYRLDQALNGETWTNPVIAGDYVVLTTDQGETLFIQAGRDFKTVTKGRLDPMLGTPAFTGGEVYVRTHKRMWAFGG